MAYFGDALKEVIPYMVSGSTAANLYAQPRATNDIDIVVAVERKQADILLDTFKEGFYISQEGVRDAFDGVGMLNIIHYASVVKIDLIILKTDEFSHSAFRRRVQLSFEGVAMWFISLEDLVLQKLIWHKESGSELQLEDVRRLIFSNRGRIDEQYCLKWAEELGLVPELRGIL